MEKRIVTKKVLYGVLADYFKGVDVQLIGGKTKENEDIILHSQDIIDMLNMEIELLTKKATSSNTTKKTKKDEETEKLIEILKSELSKMGEVNTGAIAEYERVSTRYDFLSTQKEDLTKSAESLTEIIEVICSSFSSCNFKSAFLLSSFSSLSFSFFISFCF